MVIVADPAIPGNVTQGRVELPLGSEKENSNTNGNNSAETVSPRFTISFNPDDCPPDRVDETEGSVVAEVRFTDHPGWCRSLRGWREVVCPHRGVVRVPMRDGKCVGCFNRWRDRQEERVYAGCSRPSES